MIRQALILATALSLSACISFGADPPDSLLNLTATAQVAPGRTNTAASAQTVTVLVPTVPQTIATQRVPVSTVDGTVAYVKDAQWVEAPNRLFQRLLSETIEAQTGRTVLTPRQFDFDPGTRLSGELQRFGIDAATGDAVVTYDAVISVAQGSGENSVRTRRFEARVPVAPVEALPVGAALNQAANRVAAEVASWIDEQSRG
ncbi:cholesterol transport system auxiliary component [Sphingomonas jejuensis]|uniref:Cholesterol transport system auxiliary component n=1 Tax=Sphingomonas jejuensis TaxID=904715 RepID=A0ABX0XM88_9SPHN|nr:ABC-type transport auxiliary lipoprotein family protein [Sphingomonas jejuensis]NJC33924.1 cholesterol transport system auxiliary component [Sphingomonas jejuensis]